MKKITWFVVLESVVIAVLIGIFFINQATINNYKATCQNWEQAFKTMEIAKNDYKASYEIMVSLYNRRMGLEKE